MLCPASATFRPLPAVQTRRRHRPQSRSAETSHWTPSAKLLPFSEGRSAAVRDLTGTVCSAAKEASEGAATVKTPERSQTQNRALLLSPSVEIPSSLRDLFKDSSGSTQCFVLIGAPSRLQLTPNDLIQPLEGSAEISKPQADIIEAFKRTPFYQLLFALCPDGLQDSKFYRRAAVLPCRMKRDGSWDIAWDIVQLIIQTENHETAFHSFLQSYLSCYRNRSPSEELIEAMKQISAVSPVEFGSVGGTVGWTDVEGFLKRCTVVSAAQSPLVAPCLEPKMKSMHGFRVDIETGEAVEVENVTLFDESRIVPLPGSWLLDFLALQRHLPEIHARINASQLITPFGFGQELPVDVLHQKLALSSPDFKKSVALGSVAIRLVSLLNGWQSSDSCRIHNSKAIRVRSSEDTRNITLAEYVNKSRSLSDLLFAWVETTAQKQPITVTCWEQVLLGQERTPNDDEEGFMGVDLQKGQTFKAFVGAATEALSLPATWKICKAIGMVENEPGSCLEPYLSLWRSRNRRFDKIQPWEKLYIRRPYQVKHEVYEEFCSDFGYTFRQKHRFDWAMTHASCPGASSSLYFWLSFIGSAVLDVFVQVYVTETQPELSQTDVNRIFDSTFKMDLCFGMALELKLHQIGLMSNLVTVQALMRHRNNPEELKADNSARSYMTMLMMTLLGAVAFDAGLYMPAIMEILKPQLGKRIDSYSEVSNLMYEPVNRYVPLSLEASHFESSRLTKSQYYPTLVEVSRQGSSEVCFSLCVLTKLPLPQLQGTEMYHYTDEKYLQLEWTSSASILEVSPQQKELLETFQSEWFEPVLAPETVALEPGPQTKKYLVVPAKNRGGGAAMAIDWDLMEHVVQQTVPDDISTLLSHLQGATVDEERLKEAASSVLKQHQNHSLREIPSRQDSLEEAVQQLVFMTVQRHVLSPESSADGLSELLNQQCLQGMVPGSPSGRPAIRRLPLELSTARCLPYTVSYFKCLACVPHVLDALERRLIVDDYRRAYSVPKSISDDELQFALTSASDVAFGRLTALGQNVVHYLMTLSIVRSTSRDSEVGDLAVVRARIQNARDFASLEDTHFLMGHLQTAHLFVDKEWSPPGIPPFSLGPMVPPESPPEEKSEGEKPVQIEPVRGRLGTGYYNNICTGVPVKHFKVVAALCFLHEGIEAACTYLNQIGTIDLSECVKQPETQRTPKPSKKKYKDLQATLGYRFRNEKTLAQAFMHSSVFPDPADNNEILEFLGDAVLDLCIYNYLHEAYPEIPVPQTTLLKVALTNNNLFGWISASLELPYLLMHRIDGLYEGLDPAKRTKKGGITNPNVSKVASDVLEALVGAVLIDSGFSVKRVDEVVRKLLSEVLEDPASFGIEITPTE